MRRFVTPPSLKWLINKKARLLGEINSIEKLIPYWHAFSHPRFEALERRADSLRKDYIKNLASEKKLPKLKTQLEAIEIALSLHDIQINTELISPIKTHKQKAFGRYGSMTRGIYEYLKENKTGSTKEIAEFIFVKNELEIKSINFFEMKRAVGSRLRAMTRHGKIERLHTLKGLQEGIWKLPS